MSGTKRLLVVTGDKENMEPPAKLTKWHSDDQPPVVEMLATKYKWRGDPEETFSDWNIEIVARTHPRGAAPSDQSTEDKDSNNPKEQVQTYHVHKCVLAYGSTSSKYFEKLFFRVGKNVKESSPSCCTSRIELEPMAAHAFPSMLDFMYSPEQGLVMEDDEEKATALHYLGDYFEIHSLRWHVYREVETNMKLTNVLTFYEHATRLADAAILDLVAKFLGQNILKIYPDSPLLDKMDPTLWLAMVDSLPSGTAGRRNTRRWSKLVERIASHHQATMTYMTFQRLTHPHKMPEVHPEVAWSLCELQNHLFQRQQQQGGERKGLSSLQKRCSVALAEWSPCYGLESNIREGDQERLLRQTPEFLVDLIHRLVATRSDARDNAQELKKQLEEATEERDLWEEQASDAEAEQEEAREAAADAESDKVEAQNKLKAAQEELRALQAFIQRLRPLPASASEEEKESVMLPDQVCQKNPLLQNVSLTVTTQLGYQQLPVFYYDPSVPVEEEMASEAECEA